MHEQLQSPLVWLDGVEPSAEEIRRVSLLIANQCGSRVFVGRWDGGGPVLATAEFFNGMPQYQLFGHVDPSSTGSGELK